MDDEHRHARLHRLRRQFAVPGQQFEIEWEAAREEHQMLRRAHRRQGVEQIAEPGQHGLRVTATHVQHLHRLIPQLARTLPVGRGAFALDGAGHRVPIGNAAGKSDRLIPG